MKPIEFKGQTHILNKNHEDGFMPLPCFKDGERTISCWELTDDEIKWITENRCIWSIITAGPATPPQALHAGPINFRQSLQGALLWYQKVQAVEPLELVPGINAPTQRVGGKPVGSPVRVWCAEDFTEVPEVLIIDGGLHELVEQKQVQYEQSRAMNVGDLYLRMPTLEEGRARAERLVRQFSELPLPNLEAGEREFILENLRGKSLTEPVLVRKLQAGREEVVQ